MTSTLGYGAQSATSPLAPMTFERRDPLPRDVRIEILFCGICHSDLHQVRDEWGGSRYPMVPGHEIVGRVTDVGAEVERFAPGDLVGVGCMVDSCRTCASCRAGLEQYCERGFVPTYNGEDPQLGGPTFGGYARDVVVDEDFVLRMPEGIDLAGAAPLLCAGITTFSPLRHWGVRAGDRVGVIGLGGLGHVAIKIAAAMGAHVVLFTRSTGKADDARRLGARDVVLSTDPGQLRAHENSLDVILDTVAAAHDLNPYLGLLKREGTLVGLGIPPEPNPPVSMGTLIMGRRRLSGSAIGGIAETQEMLDFCAQHGIVADIELIAIDRVNEAYERMLRSDVKYRFVIDLATLDGAAGDAR